jgi:nucleotide-binding universal stress UspA family protein
MTSELAARDFDQRDSGRSQALSGGRILALLDGSEKARQELARAVETALERNALLEIAGVAVSDRSPLLLAAFAIGYQYELARRETESARELEIREALRLIPRHLSVRTRVLSGRPRKILPRLLSEHHYDLCFAACLAN